MQKLTDLWQRTNMTVGKLVLLLVLIALCTVLAFGNTFGADSGNNVTITDTTANGHTVTATTTPGGISTTPSSSGG